MRTVLMRRQIHAISRSMCPNQSLQRQANSEPCIKEMEPQDEGRTCGSGISDDAAQIVLIE